MSKLSVLIGSVKTAASTFSFAGLFKSIPLYIIMALLAALPISYMKGMWKGEETERLKCNDLALKAEIEALKIDMQIVKNTAAKKDEALKIESQLAAQAASLRDFYAKELGELRASLEDSANESTSPKDPVVKAPTRSVACAATASDVATFNKLYGDSSKPTPAPKKSFDFLRRDR